jgi:hypothetical protein
MNILIAGALGNMGRRYTAICKHLGHTVIPFDLFMSFSYLEDAIKKNAIDRCIIATPIESHLFWCNWCIGGGIPFLCEKPMSTDVGGMVEIMNKSEKQGTSGHMVNNWAFVAAYPLISGKHKIIYDYYNTGKDGWWDYIQPVYLGFDVKIKNESPVFECEIDGIHYNQRDFDLSYVEMVEAWLLGETQHLWDISQAIEATKKIKRMYE